MEEARGEVRRGWGGRGIQGSEACRGDREGGGIGEWRSRRVQGKETGRQERYSQGLEYTGNKVSLAKNRSS